jgi:hypothetical protein
MLLQVSKQLAEMNLPNTLMKNTIVTGGNTITPFFKELVSQDLT